MPAGQIWSPGVNRLANKDKVEQRNLLLLNPNILNRTVLIEFKNLAVASDWRYHKRYIEFGDQVELIDELNQSQPLSANDEEYLELTYQKIVKLYVSELSSYHEFSCEWEHLIGPWLRLTIFHSYQVWLYVQRTKRFCSSLIVEDTCKDATPDDFNDFTDKLFNGVVNNFMCNVAARYHGVNTVIFRQNATARDSIAKVEKSTTSILRVKLSGLARNLTNILVSTLFFFRKNRTYVYSVRMPYFLILIGNIFTKDKWLFLQKLVIKRSEYESSRSKEFRINLSRNDEFAFSPFHLFIMEVSSHLVPKIYLDDISFENDVSRDHGNSRIRTNILTSTAQWNDDKFKLWIARSTERVGKLIIYQHGGTYGTTKVRIQQEKYEVSISDTYLTWGWMRSGVKKICPFVMAPPSVSLRRKKPIKSIGAIRIILTRVKPFSRGDPWDTSEWNSSYLKDVVQISLNASRVCGKPVLVRLHPSQREIYDIAPFLKAAIPDCVFDEKESMENSELEFLDILTQNSTVLLNRLSANTPILFYIDIKSNPLNEEAQPFYEELMLSGICHTSVESIVRHLENLKRTDDSLSEWWHSTVVQNAVDNFCDHFANHSVKNIMASINHLVQ